MTATGPAIIVTADHAQAAQIFAEPSLYARYPILYSPGRTARVRTPEGGMLRINYATNGTAGACRRQRATSNRVIALAKPFLRQREVYQAMSRFLPVLPGAKQGRRENDGPLTACETETSSTVTDQTRD